MTTVTKHIVFFAEAVTLAHIARCIALANVLVEHNYRVTLVADSRYNALLGELNFPQIPLYSVSSQYFAKKLSQGLPLYATKILTGYVNEDLKIIAQQQPDFIIGDFRLSLAISARLAKVPYATLTNAYWSPYAVLDYPVPEISLTKICGVAIAQHLFNWVRPFVFKLHASAFNRTCEKFGLSPLRVDMREVYTHADYTLYADDATLFTVPNLPANHVFIGPVLWSAVVPMPEWWATLPADKPIVFVTLGSSGDSRLLPMLVDTLGQMPVTVICVTASLAKFESRYPNVFISEFLPSDVAVKKADILICNGGSPMVYQGLAENKAIIGIPSNLDQYLMMSVLLNAGKGRMIRAGNANTRSIRDAVGAAIDDLSSLNKLLPQSSDYCLDVEKLVALIDSAIGSS